MMQRCWVNGELVVIWAFNPTREALAVVVNASGTLQEPGPWVYTGSAPEVLKLTDYYLICRANPNDVATVPRIELSVLSSHAMSSRPSRASARRERAELVVNVRPNALVMVP